MGDHNTKPAGEERQPTERSRPLANDGYFDTCPIRGDRIDLATCSPCGSTRVGASLTEGGDFQCWRCLDCGHTWGGQRRV